MSIFSEADRLTANAMDDHFAEPVVWRPMLIRKSQSSVSVSTAKRAVQPDLTRPVRGLDQATDRFVAVVVWRPSNIDPGTNDAERNSMPANTVLVDINVEFFRDASGIATYPKVNDWFEVKHVNGKTYNVQITRDPEDDGTGRLPILCVAVD